MSIIDQGVMSKRPPQYFHKIYTQIFDTVGMKDVEKLAVSLGCRSESCVKRKGSSSLHGHMELMPFDESSCVVPPGSHTIEIEPLSTETVKIE